MIASYTPSRAKDCHSDRSNPALKHSMRVSGYYVDITEDGWTRSTIFHVAILTICMLLQMPPLGNILGLCLPMRPNKFANKPQTRRLGTLHVCLVTKGTNIATAIRSARCWDRLSRRNHPSIKFHALVDSDNADELQRQLPSYVILDQVPSHVPVTKAKYKARAQEYFRLKYKFSKEDWVLHLDEESQIDDRVLEITLNFIERGTADLGMVCMVLT